MCLGTRASIMPITCIQHYSEKAIIIISISDHLNEQERKNEKNGQAS